MNRPSLPAGMGNLRNVIFVEWICTIAISSRGNGWGRSIADFKSPSSSDSESPLIVDSELLLIADSTDSYSALIADDCRLANRCQLCAPSCCWLQTQIRCRLRILGRHWLWTLMSLSIADSPVTECGRLLFTPMLTSSCIYWDDIVFATMQCILLPQHHRLKDFVCYRFQWENVQVFKHVHFLEALFFYV